jgi:hypothetical protein
MNFVALMEGATVDLFSLGFSKLPVNLEIKTGTFVTLQKTKPKE